MILLERSLTKLKKDRNKFEELVEGAKKLSENWNFEPTLAPKQSRTIETFFDELTKDVEFIDQEHHLK